MQVGPFSVPLGFNGKYHLLEKRDPPAGSKQRRQCQSAENLINLFRFAKASSCLTTNSVFDAAIAWGVMFHGEA